MEVGKVPDGLNLELRLQVGNINACRESLHGLRTLWLCAVQERNSNKNVAIKISNIIGISYIGDYVRYDKNASICIIMRYAIETNMLHMNFIEDFLNKYSSRLFVCMFAGYISNIVWPNIETFIIGCSSMFVKQVRFRNF